MGGLCESKNKNETINYDNKEKKEPKNEEIREEIKPTLLNPYMSYITKSICKISVQNVFGSGFLIKLYKNGEDFFCLMTCGHVITKDIIEQGRNISFYYDSIAARLKEIELNQKERFIINFSVFNANIDVTVIEILPEDKISSEFFLSPNLNYINDIDDLEKRDIIILQYPGGKLAQASGKIEDIYKKDYQFSHSASTEKGSSGSPVFLKDSIEVIGIHKSGVSDNSENYGNFIGPVFNFFKNFPKIKKLLHFDKNEMFAVFNMSNKFENKFDMYIAYASKSVCQVEIKKHMFSGFLLKLFKGEQEFYCLVTVEHFIKRETIQKRETISFIYDNSNAITKIIKLDPDKRFIQDFKKLKEIDENIDINIGATIIEILPEDNIPEDYFLSINENYINHFDNLENQDITIIGYPEGELGYSFGTINEINKYEIAHSAETTAGSTGSPIFLKNTDKVIGMHSLSVYDLDNGKYGIGYCLGPIYNFFKNFSENENELNIKLYKRNRNY